MKKILVCLLFVILVMPLFLALDLNIKTLPGHKISVIIRAVGQLSSLDSYHQETGDGNVFISSEVSEDPVDLLVTLKKDDINILNKKFEGVSTAKLININFVPGEEIGIFDKKEKNETQVNVTESNASVQTSNDAENSNDAEKITNQTSEIEGVEEVEKPGITSKAIENIKDIVTSKTTYYIIAGIVAVVILFFAVRFTRGRFPPESFRVTKLSSISSHDKRLEDAERKLDDAKKELDEIKNRKNKLEEARERFKRDQKELASLEKSFSIF